MESIENTPVGQIAATDFRICDVFEKYGIDYYNQGKRRLSDWIREKDLDGGRLISEIEKSRTGKGSVDFDTRPLDELAAYIVKTYHRPAEERIGRLKAKLESLLPGGSGEFPEIQEIKEIFDQVAGQIAMHQRREELILFPYIRKMTAAIKENKTFERPPMTKSAENPVNMLTHEHHDQGEAFEKIKDLTGDYTVSGDKDEALKEVYALLKEFEQKLHRHLHLENNILFPKALEMDRSMAG